MVEGRACRFVHLQAPGSDVILLQASTCPMDNIAPVTGAILSMTWPYFYNMQVHVAIISTASPECVQSRASLLQVQWLAFGGILITIPSRLLLYHTQAGFLRGGISLSKPFSPSLLPPPKNFPNQTNT